MEVFPSPRPTPKFFPEPQTFSTKKSRGTPRDSLPPKPPVKSAPPISRIFPHRPIQRAQIVSFRDDQDVNGLFLGANTSNSKKLYFETGFQVISKLGAGSFGEVFKVRSKEDGKYYAVKKSQEKFRGEMDRKRKLEEVAKHESLPSHPNCVTFFRAWEERQHLYIQEELCQTNLLQYAESRELPEKMIWKYLVDLLMALKHLHDHNHIHMDIKPDNIFISHDKVCKLGDFGLVIDLSKGGDFSESQEGDPKYLAPELMDGKFSKAADIFSLGMTVLELASDLDLPRGGDGWHLLRTGHLPEEFLRDKSFDLKYVIQQMLDPEPTSRPTVDQVLAFPYVRKIWKRRQREYMMNSAVNTVQSMFQSLFQAFLFLTTLLTWPYHYFRPALLSENSGRSSVLSSNSTGLGLDHSLSDDDCFEDEFSIHNNSMGIPLDSSSSSESFLSEFAVPRDMPLRKAYTSPVMRHRPKDFISSPMSSSPVMSNRITNRSPNLSFESSFEEERAVTPTTFTTNLDLVGEDVTKPGIEPKNLMDMFEAASDED